VGGRFGAVALRANEQGCLWEAVSPLLSSVVGLLLEGVAVELEATSWASFKEVRIHLALSEHTTTSCCSLTYHRFLL
jgi:hypothetical protein